MYAEQVIKLLREFNNEMDKLVDDHLDDNLSDNLIMITDYDDIKNDTDHLSLLDNTVIQIINKLDDLTIRLNIFKQKIYYYQNNKKENIKFLDI